MTQPTDPFLDCQTLKSLERPRYFTGQLLTAEDLRSEQDYIIARQRLHHRYLHAQTAHVFAGLNVKRGNKDATGSVDIEPGYAIDYCGNDIVVPQQASFGVIQQIRAHADASPHYQRMTWNPQKPAPTDMRRKHYWLTIAYDEQEVAPTTSLHQHRGEPVRPTTPSQNSPFACEPTRIREWYRFDIVESLPINAAGETVALEDAHLTGDNHLILARITVEDNTIVDIENAVAARLSEPQAAITILQQEIALLKEAILVLQKEIAQLKASYQSPEPQATKEIRVTETIIVEESTTDNP